MDFCTLFGVLLIVVLIATVVILLNLRSTPSTSEPHSFSRPHHPFQFCPSCDSHVLRTDDHCSECQLDLTSKTARRLERIRTTGLEIKQLQTDGKLDAETVGRVHEQLRLTRRELLQPNHVASTEPPPVLQPLTPPPLEPAADVVEPTAERPHVTEPPPLPTRRPRYHEHGVAEQIEPTRSAPPPLPVVQPSKKSLGETLAHFLQEKNILWGELAGGLLIVGCSIALVLSLWRTLEDLPYFTFLLLAGITAAVFGAGYYTYHHWRLAGTSKALMVIAILLTPLNLLLLADPGSRGVTNVLDIGVKISAILGFAWIVRTSGRDLVEGDSRSRRWWLALAIVGVPASQMIPSFSEMAILNQQAIWLPLIGYVIALGVTLGRHSREQRQPDSPALSESTGTASLLFLGLAVFALFASWGFVLSRSSDLPLMLRQLALPMVIVGVPILSAGLLIQRRISEPVGLRATGTGVAVVGIIVLFASLVLAWPDPQMMLLAATASGLLLGWVAYRDELPWLYAGAIPCTALAVVLGYQANNIGWLVPEASTAGARISQLITSATSGTALVGWAMGLLIISELAYQRTRQRDALAIFLGACGVALTGLFLVTLHGLETPMLAMWTHAIAGVGFVAASVRWPTRTISQFGIWCILLATLWGLYGQTPDSRDIWGLTLAAEACGFAVVAWFLREPQRLRNALRNVAFAILILAPVISISAYDLRQAPTITGMLFLLSVTGFVLALLYRSRWLVWAGSLLSLLGIVHLLHYPLAMESRPLAVLLGLLIHATLAFSSVLLLRRQHTTATEGSTTASILLEPLRYSSRLTSCLAVPLLIFPDSGLAAWWALFAVWTGGLWLATALVWKERGVFAAFQFVVTWAAGLLAFAWVEQQEWYSGPFGGVDPRALQAYGVAIALLSLGWECARRLTRRWNPLTALWDEFRPAMDQLVFACAVVGQLLLAAWGILPHVAAELTPLGQLSPLTISAEASHYWGLGAWVMLGLMAVCLTLTVQRHDEKRQAMLAVIGFTLLTLTLPFLLAGYFTAELAAATALRWGLAVVFVLGSIISASRESLARIGLTAVQSPGSSLWIRGLLAGGAAIILLLTTQLALLGFAGKTPSGPVIESVFRQMGWTVSVVVPLALIVSGIALTAYRERSTIDAYIGGLIWLGTLSGGYALGIVTSGGSINEPELIRIALLAIGAGAFWGIAWLATQWRIPSQGLLSLHLAWIVAAFGLLCGVPVLELLAKLGEPLPTAFVRLGTEGWAVWCLVGVAVYWKLPKGWKSHAIYLQSLTAGVLLACSLQPWDDGTQWLSLHVLSLAWAVVGLAFTANVLRTVNRPAVEQQWWLYGLSFGLVLISLRTGWRDPWPWLPATLVSISVLQLFAVAIRARSLVNEYIAGLLTVLASGLLWVAYGQETGPSWAYSIAAGFAIGGSLFAGWRLRSHWIPPVTERPTRAISPPFSHMASILAVLLLMFAAWPSFVGEMPPTLWLVWGTWLAVGLSFALLWKDPTATFQDGGVYLVGLIGVGLLMASIHDGPIWLAWECALCFAGFAIIASFLIRRWDLMQSLLVWQMATACLVIALATHTAVTELQIEYRLTAPLAMAMLVIAMSLLWQRENRLQTRFQQGGLVLIAMTLGMLAWALPDPTGNVPWLTRHAGLFVAFTIVTAMYLNGQRFINAEATQHVFRQMAGIIGILACVMLVVVLIQQIPQFDPQTKRTPLDLVTVFAVTVGIIGLLSLTLQCALRPTLDPLGPTPHGRGGYVYLAETLLVLVFVHLRLNVPELFTGQAVRYWTFIVMLLAFAGVGLAELFASRGLQVLTRPLLRTGALLPLIPLLAFWAKPPAMLMEYADTNAPGLRPMLGYLEKLPQHFDVYALLWFLAGMLYGLLALTRRSFGWALLGALATNAGLWALLTHNNVPAIIHPQAWAIPLALIVLISEYVNRSRLKTATAAGLRYLGISMIYVASASDLFIAGVGQSLWLPVILAALCLAGVLAGVLLRIRAFLYLGLGFLLLDIFSMIWHAAVDRQQTWVWYASGIILGVLILAIFALLEKRRNDVQHLISKLREWQ